MLRILSVLNPGMAFLILIGIVIVFIAGLLASGIVSIKIERVDDEDEDSREDKEEE